MIPIYNLVALWLACTFTGAAIAMLYPLVARWRLERRERSSREPFQGVDIAMLSEPGRQLVLDAMAFRAGKPSSLWPPLIGAILSFALACDPYQHAFHPTIHAELPTAMMSWPLLLLTMGAGFCFIPVLSIAFVEASSRKMRRDIRKRREALAG